jgi:RES domain-containing protein
MIVTQLDHITAYRVHAPRWAPVPLSGAGAATHGGRVNRPGVEALYLALDVQTAIDEYKQVSTLLPPGTFVTYQISAAPIVDFCEGFNAREWDPLWEDFYCDWRALWFNNRTEPPSWVLGDLVLSAGAKGVLFNSRLASTGTNLVLYPSVFNEADTMSVFDPTGALPKNQTSWE